MISWNKSVETTKLFLDDLNLFYKYGKKKDEVLNVYMTFNKRWRVELELVKYYWHYILLIFFHEFGL